MGGRETGLGPELDFIMLTIHYALIIRIISALRRVQELIELLLLMVNPSRLIIDAPSDRGQIVKLSRKKGSQQS